MAKYELRGSSDLPEGWLDSELTAALSDEIDATLAGANEGFELTLAYWGQSLDLPALDAHATRIAAALTLVVGEPLQVTRVDPPLTTWPVTGSINLLRIVVTDGWVEAARAAAEAALIGSDPRSLPGWEVFLHALGVSDSVARFTMFWAVLDLLLQADTIQEIDDALAGVPHVLPRECPDRHGSPNRETFPTFCRQRLAHAHGRKEQAALVDLPADCDRASATLKRVILDEFKRRVSLPGL